MNSQHYRPDIQGLRAIAVLAVILFHFNPAWLPGGFIGVDVFLVISGFLITSILLHKREQPNYSLLGTLKYFYTSRFKRIVPAYFVMLIVVAFIAAVFFLPQDFNTFKKSLEKAAWFNSNTYFAGFGDYFAPANHEQPLLHTWSLAVEIQFYLLAPFMVLLLPIRWLKWIYIGLLIGLTAIAEYRLRIEGIEQATYYSLYARLPAFFVGGIIALYIKTVIGGGKKHLWYAPLGLLMILMAATAQPKLGPFPGVAALLPVVGSALLLRQSAEGWATKFLCHKTLVWIGALSYSLYLWHWPVLAFLRYYTGAEVLSVGFSLLFILLTFVLSIASYYGVERVFRTKRSTKKQALCWALLVASFFGTSQVMARVNEVFTPEQLPIEYRRYADPATICHGKIVGDCLKGDLSSGIEVLVLGDSHAAMLNHFFDYLGKELGFKARVITGSSCVTIPGFDYQRIPEWAHLACLAQIAQGQLHQSSADKVFLVGSWSYHIQSENFVSAFQRYLQNMATQNKDVVILSQIPRFMQSAMRAKRFDKIGFSNDMALDSRYLAANQQLAKISENYSHVTYLTLDNLSVFAEAPFWDGKIIYRDEHHINEIGAKGYAQSAHPIFKDLFNQQQ